MTYGYELNVNFPIVVCVIGLVIFYFIRMKKWSIKNIILFSSFCVYLSFVISKVFFPIPISKDRIDIFREIYADADLFTLAIQTTLQRENILNIIMTLPLGVYLRLLFKNNKLISVLAIGLLFSFGIETIQLILSILFKAKAWHFDINDILMNTIGTAIGFLITTFLLEASNYFNKRHNI